MKRLMITTAWVFGFSMGAIAEEASPTVSLKRLSLESANQITLGAVEACRKKGIQIGVTVVDRDGTVQAVMRDTIAAQITVPISRMKAFTAVNFNAPTSALKDRADSPIGRIDGLVMSAGGLPVQAGGQLLGGVGVSGAPSGETDEACAQAGIDKIIDDLEMEM
ncbi:MAG: heme-binding protein [Candidatus Thiodiazotropha sp. (ex Lucinoma kastoroae)]|nr:heme-binding protein [Candidatus Thiodiazotropha sp. (ex Rostrolucina anterorostrata)]MCU7847865.1 heme-binding protein [Candidatus Thiodiazotropha sp. (ex Lucinoma kastoroae)]MCU7862114.1 heme-binding protein [Candidatus Thiodiazotropha sp. (ex Lucinoma kastoroae)]